MTKAFTEKRYFEYHEDEMSVTLRNKSGSYGGGQKYWCYGADLYNHEITGQVTMTLTAERADPHHMPCVVINYEREESL